MTYSSQTLSKMQWESQAKYFSLLHGSLLAAITPWLWFATGGYDYDRGSVLMNLTLERLDCHYSD